MRPASLRPTSNPFVRTKRKAGGQKLGLDLDRIPINNNHRQQLKDTVEELSILRRQLIWAEQEGKYSKAKKLRRQINQHLEAELYIRNSWCYGCNHVLHNCQCEVN